MAAPTAAVGLLGGAIVDRFDRFRLMIVADICRMVVVAALAAAVLTGAGSTVVLLIGTMLLAVPSALFVPAMQAVLPDLAGGDLPRLVRMDALIVGSFNTVTVLGASLSGILLSVVSIAWLLLIDAATFGISAVLILFAARRAPASREATTPPEPRSARSLLAGAGAGIAFVVRDRVLRPQFVAYPILDAAQFSLVFVLPALLQERGHGGAALFGLAVAGLGVGRVIGLLLMTHTPLMRRRGMVMSGNYLLQGLAVLLLLVTESTTMSMLATVLVGLPAGAATLAVTSFLQTNVPRQLRGRAIAGVMTLSSALLPLGPLALGFVAVITSQSVAVLCIAGLFLCGGLFIAAHRDVRRVR
jgi:predicted MFS family arabinose efflux permease